MTLPVSLRAPSPRGRLRKKTGLGTGRREKRDDEMWERWTEERARRRRGGIYSLKAPWRAYV